jgi:RimJ/RimL family protein N-acetyltransferase
MSDATHAYRLMPTIDTPRLVLRPFEQADALEVQRLAGAREIAAATAHIPHPYPDGVAELWISTHAPHFDHDDGLTLAVTRREDGILMGAISLMVEAESKLHGRAELGYWLGVPYWGHGYCTEAARALVDYGFGVLKLRRIFARHLGSNPASGRVMAKAGLRFEGVLRQHHVKWGRAEDDVRYGLLRCEWEEAGHQEGEASFDPTPVLQPYCGHGRSVIHQKAS